MNDRTKSYVADIVQFLKYGTFSVSEQGKAYTKREVAERYFSFFNCPEPFFNLLVGEGIDPKNLNKVFAKAMEEVRNQLDIERV